MTQAKSIAEAGQDILKDGVQVAKASARKVKDDVKAEAKDRADAAKTKLADKVSAEAARLEGAADQMTDGAPHTQETHAAAQNIQNAATHLGDKKTGDLIADVANLVRQNPVAAASVAALAGFAIGRFIKSSARAESTQSGPDLSLHHIPASDGQASS